MGFRLIIDGNAVYEIDEDCAECRKRKGGFQSSEKKQGKEERAVQKKDNSDRTASG